ncbi:CRE-CRB-1 protein [Aphelenchoides avenae]|nr:CRE-CRB-1 protein [Aphelenchus avenae]
MISDVLDMALNDADWYEVHWNTTEAGVVLEVFHAESGFLLVQRHLGKHSFGVFTTRFGRRENENYFVGCLQDAVINGRSVDLMTPQRSVDVSPGCSRREQCTASTCQNSAKCIDLWTEFRCECKRPFLGPLCANQLVEHTFGHADSQTSVELAIEQPEATAIRQNTDISFILRTQSANASILYLGQDDAQEDDTFISAQLANGTLLVQTRLGGSKVHSQKGNTTLDDNKAHLIEIRRADNNLAWYVDGEEDSNMQLSRPFAHPLLADRLVLGGPTMALNDAVFHMSKTDGKLKGTLQDIRINERSIVLDDAPPDFEVPVFGRKISDQNLLQGTVSDDVCGSSTPCKNGQCRNTFNDYVCDCRSGYMGQNCTEVDHCARNPCPQGVSCVNTHGGYVCVGPATFATTSTIKYKLLLPGTKVPMDTHTNFTFDLRTRTSSGRVVKLQSPKESLWIDIQSDSLAISYSNQTSTIRQPPLALPITDGDWHSFVLTVDRGFSQGLLLTVDNGEPLALQAPFSLKRFASDKDSVIAFGRGDNNSGFKGCLRSAKLGSLPELSFLPKELAGGSLEEIAHFLPKMRQNIITEGCRSNDVCGMGNPCKNGAECLDMFNLRKCQCPRGFEGDFCEVNKDDCFGNLECSPNGVCVDGIGDFSCQCAPGFTGPKCRTAKDFCLDNPCENGGKCANTDGGYRCECPEEFFGSRCQKLKSTCTKNPCENGGECVDSDEVKDAIRCICKDGFEGELCDIAPNPCIRLPCKNGGRCVSSGSNYTCECPKEFSGRACESFADVCASEKPCMHGTCRNIFGGFLCECDSGWRGARCNVPKDFCEDFPCENNGTCTNAMGSFRCDCPNFYFGDLCEIEGTCAKEPCFHGECVQHSTKEHSCRCERGYRGDNCEEQIDYCLKDPCKNGATCQKLVGGFQCACIAGFTGEFCETDINECVPGACSNGGKCVDRVNGFECNCKGTGYKGPQCLDDVNECEDGPTNCVHGTCSNLPGTYLCACDEGFIGTRCNMVNPCLPDAQNRTLHNCVHGRCVRPAVIRQSSREVTQHECDCFEGYGGPHCSHLVQGEHHIALGYVLGPTVALIIVCSLIGCMLFFFVARSKRANQGTYSPSTQEMTGRRVPTAAHHHKPQKQERLI